MLGSIPPLITTTYWSQNLDLNALRFRLHKLSHTASLSNDAAKGLQLLAKMIQPVYSPILEDCQLDSLDRTASFLFGLPFTSQEWPWPLENDRPLGPLVQLDLNQIGREVGEYLGSGLLQVFFPMSFCGWYGRDGRGLECVHRIIPNEVIPRVNEITAPPFPVESAIALADYLDSGCFTPERTVKMGFRSHTTTYTVCDFLEENGFSSGGDALSPAQLITGWERAPVLAYQRIADMGDDEIVSYFEEAENRDLGEDHEWLARDLGGLLGTWPVADSFPYPCLFGWPPTFDASELAVKREKMPILVFEGPLAEFGDWVEVFPDVTIWTRGV